MIPSRLAARLIVGGVLIYAGASKAAAPAEEFAYVISAYDFIPSGMALPMAGILPWIELLLGWSLVMGLHTRAAAAAAGAAFACFMLALGSVVARGIPLPNCGCFGDGVHFTPGQAFFFDSTMLALCWAALREGSGSLSLDAWTDGRK